jgi:hypothetical protein
MGYKDPADKKAYYEKNKDALRKQKKEYYQKNKDVILKRGREYRDKNKTIVKARYKQYREQNKEELRKKRKEQYANIDLDSRQKKKAYRAEWYIKNKKVVATKQREHRKAHPEVYKNKNAEFIRKFKEIVYARKASGCQICGRVNVDKPWWFDFHHPDPKQKRSSIGSRTIHTIKRLEEELKKCIVVCAFCHRDIHNGGDDGGM